MVRIGHFLCRQFHEGRARGIEREPQIRQLGLQFCSFPRNQDKSDYICSAIIFWIFISNSPEGFIKSCPHCPGHLDDIWHYVYSSLLWPGKQAGSYLNGGGITYNRSCVRPRTGKGSECLHLQQKLFLVSISASPEPWSLLQRCRLEKQEVPLEATRSQEQN